MQARHVTRYDEEPFPGWSMPDQGACQQVLERLGALHGMPRRRVQNESSSGGAILDSLVRTILSQNTTGRQGGFIGCAEGPARLSETYKSSLTETWQKKHGHR